jgi:hypothetical protein
MQIPTDKIVNLVNKIFDLNSKPKTSENSPDLSTLVSSILSKLTIELLPNRVPVAAANCQELRI